MARRARTRRTTTRGATAKRKTTGRRAPARGTRRGRRWVRHVMETSNAMDLPPGIFKRAPGDIARGLERSVLRSTRTKGTKFQSAMSMLNLYINRTGRNLGARDRKRLEAAKGELRKVFGREPRRDRR